MTRSKQLAYHTDAGGAWETAYTCPAGIVALVKTHQYFQGAGAAQDVWSKIRPSGTAQDYIYVHDLSIGSAAVRLIDLWLVLEAGDTLDVFSPNGLVRHMIHGAELQAP